MALSFIIATPNGNLPHGFIYIAISLVLGAVAFGAWGIASGVGLLNLREWSRISLIVFSLLLLALSVPAFVMMFVVKLPVPASSPDPQTTERIVAITRLGGAGVYALLSLLAIMGLIYFNSRGVKAEFAARRAMPPSLDLESALRPGVYSGGRPLSITIIAGLMALGTLSLPLYLAVFQFPFLGFYFTGPAAALIIFAFAAVQGAIAYGLWHMQPWGRSLAIYYFNFAIFNSIISVILPGAQARYENALAIMQSQMSLPTGTPSNPMHFPMWLSLIFYLPCIAVQLWFLIASKAAFEKTPIR
jgi:hypothetical protein